MPSNRDDVSEWMAEGDRLLAEAYDYLNAAESDPAQRDVANGYFSRAAQAYLAGGVEYQDGPQATMSTGGEIDDTADLMRRLDGRLRAEAEAAEKASARQAALPAEPGRQTTARAQTFAEELRERFSYAAPELFTSRTDAAFERTPVHTRSR